MLPSWHVSSSSPGCCVLWFPQPGVLVKSSSRVVVAMHHRCLVALHRHYTSLSGRCCAMSSLCPHHVFAPHPWLTLA